MRKLSYILFIFLITLLSACSKNSSDGLILIKGGTFENTNSNHYDKQETIPDFYIGKYEITQKEWTEVMGSNPSNFKGDNLPVETVSWYDCIEYCNKRSLKEGLEPYYNIDKNTIDPNNMSEYDSVKWIVTINDGANGYRLPTEAEWEYAASGGSKSKNYKYSGNNEVDKVGWFWRNAGNTYLTGDWTWAIVEYNKNSTKTIGEKNANELGLYDMSGNVREWCFDWYEDAEQSSGFYRVWKGGGWMGDSKCCEISYRGKFEANGFGADHGFRVCRNK
ncbi:formylglycine-generating enzyme family protein [Lachnoclostridium phytofermentans]|uniref:Sulfatase-modifying factor enzyme-like domain-containing protein n=1 Tax=Lachnoclostridium phytofermentans (strain ATCC 700394 / DSM 18823 / ISDg) TaxID=357809 RepID=A9KJ60_LACP7|nr:SUMF1/EgtB/PvdO family nonheme iron enzyme [Lachnoclostridium phytofermentans]ABX42472.1 protein of unknown function DUF323 [Lachnoclostridium phytofermentans ISDg]